MKIIYRGDSDSEMFISLTREETTELIESLAHQLRLKGDGGVINQPFIFNAAPGIKQKVYIVQGLPEKEHQNAQDNNPDDRLHYF